MRVLADTSGFLALLVTGDRHHITASVVWQRLIDASDVVVCTNYTLLETIALLQSRYGMETVEAFLEAVAPYLQIHWVDEPIHNAATAALVAARQRRLSLVDCVSFAVMRRTGIDIAFAFDQHFLDQDFTCLS